MTIEPTADARLVASLEERARGLPEIRQETVAAIRGDLASGVHAVYPLSLARLIVEFEYAFASFDEYDGDA
jgi:hypothetical protein